MFRSRTLAYVFIAAIGATTPVVLGAASTRAAAPDVTLPAHIEHKSSTVDASRLIASDGTFLGTAGMSGTIDTSSWQLVSDLTTGEAPRLAPVSSPSRHPHINPAVVP